VSPGDRRGFTLLEVVIALAIVGALLVIAFGGMRVALAAWRQGEDRAEAHQHARGITLVLARALGATYPYRAARGDAPEPALLFAGEARRVEFVTQAAPFPFATPIAFTAVVLELEAGDTPGLAIRQRALPNREPFAEAAVVLRDPAVTGLEIAYLDEAGAWRDRWDVLETRALPRALRLAVVTTLDGRTERFPPLTVPIPTALPQ
jgi:general secretion pathway protein J